MSDKVRWPGSAQVAVMLSFELDGPTIWGNVDERVWGWPRELSVGEYGPRRGLPRILDLLEEHQLPATFFVPGRVAEQWPERVKAIHSRGHEIGQHGYLHERFRERDLKEQRAIIERGQAVLSELIGTVPVGFRIPYSDDLTLETLALVAEMGFLYSSSMRGDDCPSRTVINGHPSDLIEIPIKWEMDDWPQFIYNLALRQPIGGDRIAGYDDTLNIWVSEFEGYHRLGLCYVVTLHPQFIGKPGRVLLLDRLIRHIKQHPGVWFARGSELAQWWRENY